MRTDHRPQIEADADLRALCERIQRHMCTVRDWERNSGKISFDRGRYEGWYNSESQRFEFTFPGDDGNPLCIELDCDEVAKVATGQEYWLDVFPSLADMDD